MFFYLQGVCRQYFTQHFQCSDTKILTVKVSQQQKFKSLGHYYWEPSKLMTRKWLTTIVILVSCTFKTHFLYNCWVSIPCRKEEIHRLEAEKICFLALELASNFSILLLNLLKNISIQVYSDAVAETTTARRKKNLYRIHIKVRWC